MIGRDVAASIAEAAPDPEARRRLWAFGVADVYAEDWNHRGGSKRVGPERLHVIRMQVADFLVGTDDATRLMEKLIDSLGSEEIVRDLLKMRDQFDAD